MEESTHLLIIIRFRNFIYVLVCWLVACVRVENWWKIVFPLIFGNVWSVKSFGTVRRFKSHQHKSEKFGRLKHMHISLFDMNPFVKMQHAQMSGVWSNKQPRQRGKKSETMKNYSKGAVILDVFNIEWKKRKLKKKNCIQTHTHTRGELWHSSINNTSNNAGEKGK